MPLSEILQQFAGGTTMHGIPKAIRSRSTAGRAFWAIVCLAAATMFCFQFIQLLQKFYSYPKKVTIEVLPLAMTFPSISLCNMRNLDNIVLNKLNQIFLESTDTTQWENYTDDTFIRNYMRVVAKYYPMFVHNDSDYSVFQTVLTRTTIATNIIMNANRSVLVNAGVPFKEFVVTCQYAGLECNRSVDFTHFFDTYYYNCYTYNAPPSLKDETLAEGLENGWSTTVLTGSGMLEKNEEIRLIPGSHEYMSPMSSSEGVRVVIHPANTTPFPHTEGFDVPPGYSVTFGVKARQNVRIGPPHGNCSDKNPFGGEDSVYRLITCQKHCLQQTVVNECGCKDISLPGQNLYPNVSYCSDDDIIPTDCRLSATQECFDALDKVYENFVCNREVIARTQRNAKVMKDCGCYPACNETTYDVSYSLSRWPAESFDGDQAYTDIFQVEGYPARFSLEEDGPEKMEMYDRYFDPNNRSKCMRDFSRLNVYIADANVLKTEEAEDFSQSQLLSDIGGQLGLWVGISVITLAEVLELVMDLCHYFSSKHGPYSQGKKFSRNPEEQERLPTHRADQPLCHFDGCQNSQPRCCCHCGHGAHHERGRYANHNGVIPLSRFETENERDYDPVHMV